MEDRTTLQLPRPVLKRLKAHVKKGETYVDALNRLLDLEERQQYIERAFATARDKKRLLPESAIEWR
ncbi:MAG TPA: hypothetical protein VGB18_06930 [Candidatus Thermoplasmatota archaeon]